MKNHRTPLLLLCFVVSSIACSAQKQVLPVPINEPNLNKPKLFQSLPEKIPVSVNNLSGLLKNTLGSNVNISLSDKVPFKVEGQVISVVSKYNNSIQSVVINCSNYAGARLTFSRTSNADGSYSYTGRIVSFQHGDLLELKKQDDGFMLVKRNYYELVNE
jgi:hypothetical protein